MFSSRDQRLGDKELFKHKILVNYQNWYNLVVLMSF